MESTRRSNYPFNNTNQSIILFDGICNLCNYSVRWILKRKRKDRFRFISLQSPEAREIINKYLPESSYPDSIVFLEDGTLFFRSDAVIQVFKKLGGLWRLLAVLRIIPAAFRNRMYDFIARNRYKWFGKNESCEL